VSLPSYAPTSDAAVIERVRAETGYADTPDELPQATAQTLVQDAKMRLNAAVQSRLEANTFYDDIGLVEALIGVTAIKAKAHVENVSVASWDFGDGRVETRTSDGESLQTAQYEQMVADGLANANVGPRTRSITNTHDYIGE